MNQITTTTLFLQTINQTFESSLQYSVQLVQNISTLELFVLKMLNPNTNSFQKSWQNEKQMPLKLKQEPFNQYSISNFQQIMNFSEETEVFLDDSPINTERFYLSSYYSNGDLSNYVDNRFDENILRALFYSFFIKQIIPLHANNIIHGDIKLENIVFDDQFNLVLIDYGNCTECDETEHLYKINGTDRYQAPEYFNKNYKGQKFDIFAIGVTLFRLLTQQFPFKQAKKHNIRYQTFLNNNDEFWAEVENRSEIQISQELKDLINKMLTEEDARISAKNILEHEWFKSHKIMTQDQLISEIKKTKESMQQDG